MWLTSSDDARDGTSAPSVAAVGAGEAVSAGASAPTGAAGATTAASDAPATTAMAATTATTVPAVDAGKPADTSGDAASAARPVFLDGPAHPPASVVLDVAVPTSDPANTTKGGASYVRAGTPDRCDTPHAPVNASIVVTNVNNGRSVTCQNRFTFGLAHGLVVVLDEALFLQIADLVDSPAPVRISW